MGRGRHNPGPLLAALAATAAAATAVLAARRAATRRRAQPAAAATAATRRPAQPAGTPSTTTTSTMRPRHLAPTTPPRTPVDAPPLPPSGQSAPAEAPPAPRAEPEAVAAEEAEPEAVAPAIAEAAPYRPPTPTVAAGPPRHLAPGSRPGRALVGVLVAIGIVVVLGAGAMVVAGAGSGETGAPAPRIDSITTEAPTTTTTTMPASPEDAFAGAASRLEAAGTFAYRGSVSASDVSAVRPSLWLAVDITVAGEASLAGGLVHEVAVADNGRATETVVVGTDVWGRSARTRDALAEAGYEGIPELSQPEPATKGAAGLAAWLAAVEEPQAAGVDPQGRRQYRGTLPAAALGPTERGRRAVDAEVVLTLDRTGQPAHVDITTVPGGPPLHLAFDLTALGAPVTIEAPTQPEQPAQV